MRGRSLLYADDLEESLVSARSVLDHRWLEAQHSLQPSDPLLAHLKPTVTKPELIHGIRHGVIKGMHPLAEAIFVGQAVWDQYKKTRNLSWGMDESVSTTRPFSPTHSSTHILSPRTLSGLAAGAIPTAAVERAPSERARSGSKGMPWLRDRPPTATPTRHIPSQVNTAPPHRHTEGPDRAACTRRPLNR